MKKSLTLSAVILAALVIIGCASTPPTALESKLFNVTTNYFPQLVMVTNTAYRTNTVIETVTTTNKIGVVVTEPFTNFVTVPVTQLTTQIVQIPAYTYAVPTNGPAAAAQGVAGVIGNIAAPGVGGPIASGIIGLVLAGWAWVRGNKQSATANNLAQTIEVARELLKSLPNGAGLDNQLTGWMQQQQAESGILPQVLDILDKTVDNPAAKTISDQLRADLAALPSPTAPKV